MADLDSPPRERAVGGGGAPDLRSPSERERASPPGTPLRCPHSAQRRPSRAHTLKPLLGPHARTNCTRDTRVAQARLPAPENGWPGEGQRLTPDAPQNSGRPPPPGTAPHHPRGTQPPQGMQAKGTVPGPHTRTPAPRARMWRTMTARPEGGQSGEGEHLTSDAPHNGNTHPPLADTHPPSPQRATQARKGAPCGPGARSPRPHQPHPGHTGRASPAARPRGRLAGGATAPDTRRSSQRWQANPPRDDPPPPPRHAAPKGRASERDSAGPPHPHTRAHSTWEADPDSPPRGRATGEQAAADLGHPSQRRKVPPPGTPFRHPHSAQRRPARAHAVGPMQGFHARTSHRRDTRIAEPRLPAPEDGPPSKGQRLTPEALRNGGGPPPRGRPPNSPAARSPGRACKPRRQCWTPTPAQPRPQQVGSGPRQPARKAGSRRRGSA